jgi:dihydroorotase-like cyclic amidohydrolase
MKADLLIINGRLVTPKGISNSGIAIKKGKIVSIAKSSNLPPSDKKIDAHNNFVIPGVIDGHVHFWDPGYTYREDWQSGTMSAASGGVTTVIDMPTTSPPTITPEAFRDKRKIAQKKAVVDFALHAGATPQTINHIPKLIKEGATSFKMFIAEKVRQFENMNKKALYEALKKIGKYKALASFHAESELVPFLRKKLQNVGRTDHCRRNQGPPAYLSYD